MKPGIFWQLRSYMIKKSISMQPIHCLLRFVIKVPAIPSFVKHGKILDIGCGSGDTLFQLKNIGWDVYGLDIDRFAIQIAHQRGLKKVAFGSYKAMRLYPDNYFDAIRLYHVIEHLDNPMKCLSLICKKLKPGGELIIGTPNGNSCVARMTKQYWYNLDCPRHLYIFSPKQLIVLLKKVGFTNIKISFSSAGGILGSIQYFLHDTLRMNIDLINRPILLFLLYPFERVLDTLEKGDVFVISAKKSI
ncbi:class I SAM-dependent methyltransferase [Patescibacteria group bacterium]|nr:class I SAM-dependent methyltransferase [Patescibacteria group bacterium]